MEQHLIRYQESRRITLLGAIKNVALAALKIIFGITGHSHALFADGLHSLSDLLIDGLVLIASRFGSEAADHNHPYGHGRIETAATVILALILILTGVGIIYEACREIFNQHALVKPGFYVLFIALFSVIINEVLYRYTKHVGERVKSNLLIANAWHHRSDSASSVVVLIGVLAACLGLGKFDAIAAVIVGVMIIHMAWHFGWTSLRELVDTGLDDDIILDMREKIQTVPGVSALHQLRTRLVGGAIYIDVHVQVNPTITVSEGHFIGQQVYLKLAQEFPEIKDVIVHVDPEDDEEGEPSQTLPSRGQVVELLKQRWQNLPVLDYLDTLILHYLAGKLRLELRVPLAWVEADEPMNRLADLQKNIADIPQIASIKLLFVD